MIKNVMLENIFGIKQFETTFELKNVPQHQDQYSQVIVRGKGQSRTAYSLIPTFLAKNASGKTSFIKAMDFATRFMTSESFIEEIESFAFILIKNAMIDARKKTTRYTSLSNMGTEHKKFDFDVKSANEALTNMLFEEVSFLGTSVSKIKVEFIDNRSIEILSTPEDTVITYTNENIKEKTKNISISNLFINMMSPIAINPDAIHLTLDLINSQAESLLFPYEDYFIKENIICHYADVVRKSREYKLKDNATDYILKLVDSFGYEATKTLLMKADKNINNFDFDPSSKTINVWTVHSKSLPLPLNKLSFGTIKLLHLLSDSVDLFKNGGVMLVDEIENGLHLSIIKLLVEIYATKEINEKTAQLIFTTHNPLILERKIVEPRNVYMTESDEFTKFIAIKNIKGYERASDLEAFVHAKNYFNDIFWLERETDPKSTLTTSAIDFIIDKFIEGSEHVQTRK